MVNVQEVFWARHCFVATGLAEGRFGSKGIQRPSAMSEYVESSSIQVNSDLSNRIIIDFSQQQLFIRK